MIETLLIIIINTNVRRRRLLEKDYQLVPTQASAHVHGRRNIHVRPQMVRDPNHLQLLVRQDRVRKTRCTSTNLNNLSNYQD